MTSGKKHVRMTKQQRNAKTKLSAFNIIVSAVLAISLIMTLLLGALAYYTGNLKYSHISSNYSDLGITSEAANNLPKGITNILLFGLDTRDKETTNRTKSLTGLSDTIIVLSINTDAKTIKMTSILRDSWVPVDGTYRKINAAYSRGGAELAIKTVNQVFGLNITDYVSISIHQLWKVIDILGGVDVQITEMERKKINYLGNSEYFGIDKVDSTGLVHLNGGQAMSYARIRDDSESYRVLRQQKVLRCLFEKIKKTPKTEYPGLLREILSNVETSLDYSEIMNFSPLASEGDIQLETKSIPGDDVVARGGIFEDTRGGWVWKYDLDEAKNFIHNWIYGSYQ